MSSARFAAIPTLILLTACSSGYMSSVKSMMRFKSEDKKEELVNQLDGFRQAQADVRTTFAEAHRIFQGVTRSTDMEVLEDQYSDLQDKLEDCYDEVEDMRERAAAIREAANELFGEWRAELDLFTNPEMRSKSENILLDVQSRYEDLSATMEQSDTMAAPVLRGFQDYVTFFNHNLNTRAIATLEDTYEDFSLRLEDLYAALNASVDVSEALVKALVD